MSKDRINTGELAALLASYLKVGIRESEDFLKALIGVMEEQLLANDILKIKGLGTFKLQWNEPRKSVDVNTSEEIVIDGYYRISYTPEPELKELVNAPYAHLEPVVLGGPEPGEMEEEVEVVEEEIMKEMEDPQKLADAMRSITEQAIEIKDILAEMNMMGGSVKKNPRPILIEEDDYPVSVPSAAVGPVQDIHPETGKHNLHNNQPEPVIPSGEGSIEVWPPVNEPRIYRQPGQPDSLEEDFYPSRSHHVPVGRQRTPFPVGRKEFEQHATSIRRAAQNSKPEMETGAFRQKTPKKNKVRGWFMLLAGIITGGGLTYFLIISGYLPEIVINQSDEELSNKIELPEETNAYNVDAYLVDTVTADTLGADTVIVTTNLPPVDSLQLLFDTPRKFTEFIATEKVIAGSRMTRISERHYGAKEFWVYIYEANRNLLNHPDDIAMGMVLKIPRVDPRLLDKNNPRCIEYAIQLHDLYLKK